MLKYKFGKIKHLLSHGIPSRSPVIKTFQNSLSLSPAKVCLLSCLAAECPAACFMFFFFPHHLVLAPKRCHRLALLEKQAHVWVFPILRTGLKFSDRNSV